MALDGKLVCIFGGGGFLGRYISQHLLSQGARVRIAERSVKNAMYIKPLGNLGQTQFASADVTKKDSVERAVHGCDMVINLVGVFGNDMEKVNVDGARNVAEAAASSGCEALIHMSAIGADPESPSLYGRSKARGEKVVQEIFADAVIVRPSVVFGREDAFVNRFAAMIQMLPVVPIIGSDTKLQPVYVGDVANAVTNILAEASSHAGKTYELGGPEILSMDALNRRIALLAKRDREFVGIPEFISKILAMLPGTPITTDQHKMLSVDNIVSDKALGLSDLGVTPTSIAAVAPGWMEQFAEHGRFGARAKAA